MKKLPWLLRERIIECITTPIVSPSFGYRKKHMTHIYITVSNNLVMEFELGIGVCCEVHIFGHRLV